MFKKTNLMEILLLELLYNIKGNQKYGRQQPKYSVNTRFSSKGEHMGKYCNLYYRAHRQIKILKVYTFIMIVI